MSEPVQTRKITLRNTLGFTKTISVPKSENPYELDLYNLLKDADIKEPGLQLSIPKLRLLLKGKILTDADVATLKDVDEIYALVSSSSEVPKEEVEKHLLGGAKRKGVKKSSKKSSRQSSKKTSKKTSKKSSKKASKKMVGGKKRTTKTTKKHQKLFVNNI